MNLLIPIKLKITNINLLQKYTPNTKIYKHPIEMQKRIKIKGKIEREILLNHQGLMMKLLIKGKITQFNN